MSSHVNISTLPTPAPLLTVSGFTISRSLSNHKNIQYLQYLQPIMTYTKSQFITDKFQGLFIQQKQINTVNTDIK
jgi:hypothetical protein